MSYVCAIHCIYTMSKTYPSLPSGRQSSFIHHTASLAKCEKNARAPVKVRLLKLLSRELVNVNIFCYLKFHSSLSSYAGSKGISIKKYSNDNNYKLVFIEHLFCAKCLKYVITKSSDVLIISLWEART